MMSTHNVLFPFWFYTQTFVKHTFIQDTEKNIRLEPRTEFWYEPPGCPSQVAKKHPLSMFIWQLLICLIALAQLLFLNLVSNDIMKELHNAPLKLMCILSIAFPWTIVSQ